MSTNSKGESRLKGKSLEEIYGKDSTPRRENMSKKMKGKTPWNKGVSQTKEVKMKNPFTTNNPTKNPILLERSNNVKTVRYLVTFQNETYLSKGYKEFEELYKNLLKPHFGIGIRKFLSTYKELDVDFKKAKLIKVGN